MTNHSDYGLNPYEKHLKVIGEALHDFMRDTGCRAAELATLIGISRTTINNIIANAHRSRPQRKSLEALRLVPLLPGEAYSTLEELLSWESMILRLKRT